MEFVFHPDALAEFKAEIAYYEGKQAGLGAAFAEETLRTIELVCLFPRIGSPERSRCAQRHDQTVSIPDLLRGARR